MRSEVGVSLLVSGVLGDEVEVFSSDDDGTVHFRRDDSSGQDAAADRDHAGEGALLVCKQFMLESTPQGPCASPFPFLETLFSRQAD